MTMIGTAYPTQVNLSENTDYTGVPKYKRPFLPTVTKTKSTYSKDIGHNNEH